MAKRAEDELFRSSVMTFGQHLGELRGALWRAVLGLALGCVVAFFLAEWVVRFIQVPLETALQKYYLQTAAEELHKINPNATAEETALVTDHRMVFERVFVQQEKTGDGQAAAPKLDPVLIWHPIDDDPRTRTKALSAQESFMIWLKAVGITGLVLSSPWVFYQLWLFVAAGLYPTERHYVYVFLPFSIGLFLFGVCTAFFFVFEPILNFFFGFNRSLAIDPEPRISEWISFVLFLPIGFGVAFQLPLVMLFLERIGVFTVSMYIEHWRISVLVIWVAAAILTPADPYSIFFLAVPMMLLFFGGLALCKWWPKKSAEPSERGMTSK